MPDMSPEDIEGARAWLAQGNKDPDIEAAVSEYDRQKAGEPYRSLLHRASALLPAAGATAGAIIGGGPTMGLGSIPGAGMGGMAGKLLQRVSDTATGYKPPLDPTSASAVGHELGEAGKEGLISAALQVPFYGLGKYLGHTTPLAKELPTGQTPFANLSDQAFGDVHRAATMPGRRVMSPPVGGAAMKGGKFATPEVATSALRGSEALKTMSGNTSAMADVLREAEQGRRMAGAIRPEMRANVDELADASGKALDKIRETLPPRPMKPGKAFTPTPGAPTPQSAVSVSGPVGVYYGEKPPLGSGSMKKVLGPPLPPGEDVVNHAFNAPWEQNSIISDAPAMQSIADVKDPALRQAALGDKLGEAERARIGASAVDTGGRGVPQLESDAAELKGLSRGMERQRSGVSQNGPSRGVLADVLNRIAAVASAPQSRMLGIRPESLEQSVLNNSARLAEIEAAKRGMPALDSIARDQALNGMERGPLVTHGIPAAGQGFSQLMRLFIPDYAQR